MSEPPPASGADPTRDIRLPPLPDRPYPPPAPSGLDVDQPTDELGQPPEGSRDPTLTFEGTAAQRWQAGLAATPDPAWSPVPRRPGPVVGPRPRERARRWPWVVLALLPVVVIVGTGIWLLLLLRGG
jgi:hypothetical protein